MDDPTPTNPQAIDVIEAQVAGFTSDPTDVELFTELRNHLRSAGQPGQLAEICELRAPHERDPVRAATVWAEAGEARYHVGDIDRGEEALRRALALDPASERAVGRMTEELLVGQRYAEAVDVMEAEIEAIEARIASLKDPKLFMARRAARHRVLGQLFDIQLGRVDRALHHWQRAWQLEPDRPEAIEAARAIYASLGDDRMVSRLYDLELEALGERAQPSGDRRARLEQALGALDHKQGDPNGAVAHLERALRLLPDDLAIKELLAEAYAMAPWPTPEPYERTVDLYLELAQKRLDAGELDGAIGFLRRALGTNPRSDSAAAALEIALTRAEKWADLDRLYKQRAELANDDDEVTDLLARRAVLLEEKLGEREAAKRCLEALAGRGGEAGQAAAARLEHLYATDGDWSEYVAVAERNLDLPGLTEEQRTGTLLRLATVARDHLSDREHAAEFLHRVLSIQPNHPEALARYADHFREKRDWRGLADLAEFSVEAGRDASLPVEEIVRRLEELAQVSELRLGDVERAIGAWRRVIETMGEQDPGSNKAKEAVRRLLSRAKMWESLVAVLEKEANAATGPRERADALKRIAQVYRERQVDPRRAIALYEDALQLTPADPAALKSLSELYEREGDDAGLARTLRRQLEADADRVQADAQKDGKRAPTAREWPTALRVERLTVLRRLATMYEQRLGDVEGVVYSCTAILELLPGDRDALDRLERVLEKACDLERLEQTLEYHAEAATGPAERAKVLKRLARLAQTRGDDVAAVERWERVLRAAPNDPDALVALGTLYERIGRFAELAVVLERVLITQKPPEPGSAQAAAQASELRRYARVVDGKLSDPNRAVKAWHRVIDILPRDREALEALSRLHETRGDWRDLAEVLKKQAPLLVTDDKKKATEAALKRARLLEERLGAPREAAEALEALIREVDPTCVEAHGALRRLYEARGDFEAAVRVAEREMYLATDPGVKTARGLEIGVLCRDRLQDSRRALHAYERVLLLEPDHGEALVAASELYARVGDWTRYVAALQKLADRAPEGRERRTIFLRIAQAVGERLGDAEDAFGWYRRAHEHYPDATTLDELRRAAAGNALWKDLADVLEAERTRVKPHGASEFVAICRELAVLVERRLGDRKRALVILKDAIEAAPDDDTLIADAERIATEAGDKGAWDALLAIYAASLERRRDVGARVTLYERRSRVRDERLDDGRGALDELLRAFALQPEREVTREGILRLASRTGRWEDAVAVEAALFGRAHGTPEKVAIARRAAQLIEEKVGDKVRAFRAYLRTFPLAPDDTDLTAHLWRLARAIGIYKEADKQARPEPAAAVIEASGVSSPPPPIPSGPAMGSRPPATPPPFRIGPRDSSKPSAPPAPPRTGKDVSMTQEISVTDLLVEAVEPRPGKQRPDQTIPLQIGDLINNTGPLKIAATAPGSERPDQTIQLQTEDLMTKMAPPPTPAARGPKPPPPPPRLPGIHANKPPVAAVGPSRAPAAPPARRYETPWEELAYMLEHLPHADHAAELRNLFRAAEVWERGAKDVTRALGTLYRALIISPGDSELRGRLMQIAADNDAWDKLAELYDDAAERARTPDEAAGLLAEIAEIRTRQGKPRDAESIYRQILGMRPDDAAVRERLEGLYRSEGRWVDLAASLEERTDPRLGVAAPDAVRMNLLRELAEIYDDKLAKPYEAISALDRLCQLHPDDADALEQIAVLYGKVGRWAKVVEMLMRVVELHEGEQRAREARRRVAEIYENELELPERAIEAYQLLVSTWPEDAAAYAALDRLLETTARWTDLAEVLRRRSALAPDAPTRVAILRRRAKILLEWLGAADDAVACLRHARTITPEDGSLTEEMVVALTKSGRAREAAAVLEGRIATMEQGGGATPGDLAALLLRLATLRADSLDDREGARRVLEKVLARVPDHPSALAALARIARGSANPRTYADALLREASAAVDVGAKVAALLGAGATLRDQLHEPAAARDAFEQVLKLEPANAEAVWALSALAAGGGELDLAAHLLEQRLAGELPDEERARALTELAALAQKAGVGQAAEKRLEEALTVKPDHLPAVIARADLYDAAGRNEEQEAFLRAAIPRLAESPGHVRAELQRRLAAVLERLGRDDEAYAELLEADKLHRNDLLTKLALGENRYRARRWREAALHLGALADHTDAATRGAELADGLYHAALAEIRSLRPDKAPALYEAALRLKPDHGMALHALAEVEIERGNVARAADLLERQAAATPDHTERLRLFEALGDLALVALEDTKRARICFEAAVAATSPLESKHMPLLEKLLARQRADGDAMAAGRTCELMASFGADAASRAQRLREAAEHYQVGGDRKKARAAAERAVDANPFDEAAIWLASELLLADGDARDSEAAASLLGRALGGLLLPPANELTAGRRAELWRRLGDARRTRGDARGAIAAYEKAVDADPESDGALAARRGLLTFLKAEPDQASTVRGHLRALVDAEQKPVEVLALARALCARTAGGPVDEDGGRATLELAAALGEILEDEDRDYLAKYPARVLASDEAYGGAIDDEDRALLIADEDDRPLADALAALWDAAAVLWPDAAAALATSDIRGAERVMPTAQGAAPAIYPQVVKALGAPATVLWSTQTPGAPDVALACVAPPLVVLGPRLMSGAATSHDPTHQVRDAEVRFVVGRAVELARPERLAAAGLPAARFALLIAGLVRAYGGRPNWLPPGVAEADADAEVERLKKLLTFKVRSKVEQFLTGVPVEKLDPDRYRAACQRAADRAGLIVCADVYIAIRLVGGPKQASHLVRLAVRERYLHVRAKIGIGSR